MAKSAASVGGSVAGQAQSVARYAGPPPPMYAQSLPKDHVPAHKVERVSSRQEMLDRFEERVGTNAGQRDPHGVAHTEDVAAKTRQARQQREARQQPTQPTTRQAASVQRHAGAPPARSQAPAQSRAIAR